MILPLVISSYLQRVGYTGPRQPIAETLRSLHRAHMFSVPFENLDISLGRKIICEEESFLRKIIERRRGGFCYELNGAFAALLRGLGFEVTLLSGRVPREDGSSSPEFDHLALLVDLEGPWLADVGFGDLFTTPVRLEIGQEQEQDGRRFRIVEQDGRLQLDRTEPDGRWRCQYSFTLVPRSLDEFAPMCHYHQTSPESPFTRRRVCSMATPDGRITISDYKLITTRNGEKQERPLNSEDERQNALQEYFGVVLG
ncbi:MAG: arylamine N-acetyltransferase [Terriglobales bacterium]